jgi:lipoprotein-anchoring transpeptidase ErfK/SrfK
MIKRVVCSVMLLLLSAAPSYAQSHTLPDWARDAFGKRSSGGGSGGGFSQSWFDNDDDDEPRQRPFGEPVRDGGPRPAIAPHTPPVVEFPYAYAANSIVIDAGARKLYYVLGGNRAYQYSVGVGREGFGWTGSEKVSRKQAWPDWHPPKEMRERDPSLPEKMTGGVRNPLGAVAIYLGNTLYRIHGTNDARSIGRAQSSGCFRMMNSSAVHLAQMTQIGTTVSVVKSLPRGPRVSRAPAARETVVVPARAAGSPSADDAEPSTGHEQPGTVVR